MTEANQVQTNTRQIPWGKLLLLGILISLQAQIWVGEGSLGELKRVTAALEQQRALNARLLSRNAQLQAQVEHLRSSNEALEGRARSELDLVRPNETLYRIVEKKNTDDEQP